MRCFFVVAMFIVAGCQSQDIARSKVEHQPKPVLAKRDEVARCLARTTNLKLSQLVRSSIRPAEPVTLEERLAEGGAWVSDDGKLHAANGKVIYFTRWIGHGTDPGKEVLKAEAEASQELERKYYVIYVNDPFEPAPC